MTADDKKHELARVGEKLVADVRSGAKAAAEKMIGAAGGPDAEKQTQAAFLDYVRRNATQPGEAGRKWRWAFLGQMIAATDNPMAQAPDGSDKLIPARNGVEHVEQILAAAFPDGYPAELPPPPPMPVPMTAAATTGPPPLAAPPAGPAPAPGAIDYSSILAQIPPDQIAAFLQAQQAAPAPQPGVMM